MVIKHTFADLELCMDEPRARLRSESDFGVAYHSPCFSQASVCSKDGSSRSGSESPTRSDESYEAAGRRSKEAKGCESPIRWSDESDDDAFEGSRDGCDPSTSPSKSRSRRRRHRGSRVKALNKPVVESSSVLVLKDIPSSFTRSNLYHILDHSGFQGMYDFVYVPMKHDGSKILGYALVNFVSESVASAAKAELDQLKFEQSVLTCNFSNSHADLASLMARYQNSPVYAHQNIPKEFLPTFLVRWPALTDNNNHS